MSLQGYGNEYRLVMGLEESLTFDSIDSTSSLMLLDIKGKKLNFLVELYSIVKIISHCEMWRRILNSIMKFTTKIYFFLFQRKMVNPQFH